MFDKIVSIAGVARSGTTWLGEILNSSPDVVYRFQPLFSYAFKDRIGVNSTREEYAEFLQDLYKSNDPFLLQTEKREAGILPLFKKVHSPRILTMKNARYHYLLIRFLGYFENLKVLAIVRNPCAVLASWMSIPKEFPVGSDPWSEWRLGTCKNQGRAENFFGFYKWRESTNIFIDLQNIFPDRVRVVRYEDLVKNPTDVTESLFDFCCLDFGDQTRHFLGESIKRHSDDLYSVYKDKNKNVKDGWRNRLDTRIVNDIEQELINTRLEIFLM
jgi:hypothetical protein